VIVEGVMAKQASEGVTDLERLMARDSIRQLAFRYALAVDTRDLDALVALFVPDVDVGRYGKGREALRRSFADKLSAIGVSILFVGNHVIDVESKDSASGIVYCHGRIEDDIRRGGRWIEQAIQYRDRYECREGEWLFVGRDHRLWYGVELPDSPLDQELANWPKSQVGRGSVPEDCASWSAFWEEVGS